MFILQNQSHGCWYPGEARSQDISSHGIDPFLPEYSRSSTRRVTFFFHFQYTSTFCVELATPLIPVHSVQRTSASTVFRAEAGITRREPGLIGSHDDVMILERFPFYWLFVRGIHERFPSQRTGNTEFFFDVGLHTLLNKQSIPWFETPWQFYLSALPSFSAQSYSY